MSVRRYYRVSPHFWIDHPWDDDTRLVALYILTSPHRTTEGLFRMPLEYARADLGWPVRRFASAFDRLVADEFVAYDERASVCLIVSALKTQAPDNANQVKPAIKAIAELPETPLLDRFIRLAVAHSQRLAEGLAERFPERFAQAIAEGNGNPPSPSPSPPQPLPSGGMSRSAGARPPQDRDQVSSGGTA